MIFKTAPDSEWHTAFAWFPVYARLDLTASVRVTIWLEKFEWRYRNHASRDICVRGEYVGFELI